MKPQVRGAVAGKVPDEAGAHWRRKGPHVAEAGRAKQVEVTESTRLVTNVTKPTLTIYRPAKEKDTGAAMLICPGGGYWNLFWELEGEEVAAWLNATGRDGDHPQVPVPRRPDEPKGRARPPPAPGCPAAVSLVRSKAKEWGIDPDRIGMIGFSAGGHLAIATATSFEKRTYEPIDDIDKVGCRPDFAIAVFRAISRPRTRMNSLPACTSRRGCAFC